MSVSSASSSNSVATNSKLIGTMIVVWKVCLFIRRHSTWSLIEAEFFLDVYIPVLQTLTGYKKFSVNQKRPLSKADTIFLVFKIDLSRSHDDQLWLCHSSSYCQHFIDILIPPPSRSQNTLFFLGKCDYNPGGNVKSFIFIAAGCVHKSFDENHYGQFIEHPIICAIHVEYATSEGSNGKIRNVFYWWP